MDRVRVTDTRWMRLLVSAGTTMLLSTLGFVLAEAALNNWRLMSAQDILASGAVSSGLIWGAIGGPVVGALAAVFPKSSILAALASFAWSTFGSFCFYGAMGAAGC